MPNIFIDKLIAYFSLDNLTAFFRNKISSFYSAKEDLRFLFDESKFEKYSTIEKIGEATIDSDELIIICSKTTEPITERTGKKRQYDIAKKVLKQEVKDAAFFIFYDDKGNFRFSFVRANYLGNRRDFTDFKRYTYFVSPTLTNNTFKRQIESCNFTTLDEIIEAFSVEPLNKQFYQEIAKAFYTLIGGTVKINNRNIEYSNVMQLPSTPIATNRKIYQEFAVRLIGRTIFCWFLKNKKSENGIPLVPESWLSSKAVEKIIEEQNDYYHSVLEKLFFLVLNRKVSERSDYLLPDEHDLIPFLNGGLFDPHINDFFIADQPNYALEIPNKWFLELFEVLEQFNFTIDENSIFDAEVSIDPEMLGTIFENLLAEIDPDTEKSARNATGSFYTPREIVDYMVEQSLIQYLKTNTGITDNDSLTQLFKEGGENKFDNEDTETILKAISKVKILDPACGSGAFPMGAVSKIILALKKLDPGAKWWREQQVSAVPNAIARKKLKEKLDAATSDYARKLGVIQNSIYGVDIQPIAAEISKLRSFLSLVIDENIDDNAVNRGIEPLPNLEFKFVTANTLIDLAEKEELKGQTRMDFGETEFLQVKLHEIRNSYLQAYGEDKETLKKEFKDTQNEIFNHEVSGSGGALNKRALQLAAWNPFGNESSGWFNPEWMFGVDKFDIVIGNPPYVEAKKIKKIASKLRSYLVSTGTSDLSVYFLEKGINLCKPYGYLCYITTNKFFNTGYGKPVRSFLLELQIKSIIDFEQVEVFKDVLVSSAIIGVKNTDEVNDNFIYQKFYKLYHNDFKKLFAENQQNFGIYQQTLLTEDEWSFPNLEEMQLKTKIENAGQRIVDLKGVLVFRGITTGFNKAFIINKEKKNELILADLNNDQIIKPLLQGRNIKKWTYNNNGEFILQTGFDINIQDNFPHIYNHLNIFHDKLVRRDDQGRSWWNLRPCRYYHEFERSEKIIWGLTADKWAFAYDDKQHYLPSNGYILTSVSLPIKYILAILNSKVLKYYFGFIGVMTAGGAFTLKHTTILLLPIPVANNLIIEILSRKVTDILNLQTQNQDISTLENEVDKIVFKLYNLSYQEVKLIDPEFPLTETEYENYNIDEQ